MFAPFALFALFALLAEALANQRTDREPNIGKDPQEASLVNP